MIDPFRECRSIIQHHSKSFALASRLLPVDCRDSAVVVYAWCRRADDAVDHADSVDASSALSRLREELHSIYTGTDQTDPVLAAFQGVTMDRRIPMEYPSELLAGMEMDVEARSYKTLDDLLLYCHRVAGVVGLMMCHVLGISDDRALLYAAHMGIAMQLTNICRDVDEDRRRGRCYLPESMLTREAIIDLRDSSSLLTKRTRKELIGPIRELLGLADRYYRSGDRGLRYLGWQSGLAIRTARLVYSAIGERVAARGYDPGAGRAYVTAAGKIALVARALTQSLGSTAIRLATRTPRIPDAVLQYPESVNLDMSPVVFAR